MSAPIRILIIEDDADLARLLVRFFQQSALEVDHVIDGQEGVDRFLAAEPPYDLLLVDGLLPTRTGFSIAEEVRQAPRGKDVGLVMMTAAFKSANSRREALSAGFDAYFAKPFVAAELVTQVIEVACRRSGKPPPSEADIVEARARIARASRERAERRRAKKQAKKQAKAAAPSTPSPAPAPAPVIEAPSTPPPKPAPKPARAASARAGGPGRGKGPPAPTVQRTLSSQEQAAVFLLEMARGQQTGIARFTHQQTTLDVAFLDGVVVAAADNLRENRLSERLMREGVLTEEDIQAIDQHMRAHKERFAEAAVALELLDEDDALNAVDEQARDRVARAAAFDGGEVVFVPDLEAVERSAGAPVDLLEALLVRFLRGPQPALVQQLRQEVGEGRLEPTRDFEPGLVPFSRLRPASTLPGQFFMGPRSLAELAAAGPEALDEVVAMRLAGMLRAPSDPAAPSAVPYHLRLDDDRGEVDPVLVKHVRRAILRARGRDHYALLDVGRSASMQEVAEAFAALEGELGRAAVDLSKLGAVRDAAHELFGRLEDIKQTMLDPDRRAAYDATLPALPSLFDDDSPEDDVEIDAKFLEGRVALSNKELGRARQLFAEAHAARPADCEFLSFYGWTTALDPAGARDEGVALLERARAGNALAVRPLFFLGLIAAREGRRDDATALLQQAARLEPENHEVLQALQALGAA